MPTFEENLAVYGIRHLKAVVDPLEEKAQALRHEVALYDSPHWSEFEAGMQRTLIERMWALVDEDDGPMVRALQMEVRRLRDWLQRPTKALEELKELNMDIEAERNSVLAAAGLSGDA